MGKRADQAGRLMEALGERERLTLKEAAALLSASESTTRRMFAYLEAQGKALRVHGALIRLPDTTREYSYDLVEKRFAEQKKRLAREAVEEILPARCVYLDSGSTLFQVSAALRERLAERPAQELRVFTNSLKNLEVLSGVLPVQLIGGEYRPNRRDFYGFLAEEALARLHFDLCVLGADGIDEKNGLTTTDFETARLNALAIGQSARRLVVADSSKFSTCALVSYGPLSAVDRIITEKEDATCDT